MDITPLELLLVRHGESQANRDGTGGPDAPMTELGYEQARRLGPWLAANFTIAEFYSSTMLRTRQTAEVLAPFIHLPIQYRDDLRECDFDMTGVLPHFADAADAIGGAPAGIQTMPPRYIEFHKRVAGAFRDIVSAHSGGTLLVVTHGGVIATLVRSLLGSHKISVNAENTSALMLRWMNDRWYLVFSNYLVHLR